MMLQKCHLIAQYTKIITRKSIKLPQTFLKVNRWIQIPKKKLKENKRKISNINKSNDGKKSMWIFIGMLINLVA
jgi:hypothetical protein